MTNPESSPKNLLRVKDPDVCLYVIGLVFAPFFVLCRLLARRIGLLPDFCVFRALTGLYCPGCGGSRAFLLLVRLNLTESLIHHPFVAYSFALGVLFYFSQTLRLISRGKIRGLHMRVSYLIIGAALLLLNWIVKNMLLLIWGIALIN